MKSRLANFFIAWLMLCSCSENVLDQSESQLKMNPLSLAQKNPKPVLRPSRELYNIGTSLVKRARDKKNLNTCSPEPRLKTVLYEELSKSSKALVRDQLEWLLKGLASNRSFFEVSEARVSKILDELKEQIASDPQLALPKNHERRKLLLNSLTDSEVELPPQLLEYAPRKEGSITVYGMKEVPNINEINRSIIQSVIDNSLLRYALVNYDEVAALDWYTSIFWQAQDIRDFSARAQGHFGQLPPVIDAITILTFGNKAALVQQNYAKITLAMNKLPKIKGTVYRGLSYASPELVADLKNRAIFQESTGLYYRGAGAITSSSWSEWGAKSWLDDAARLLKPSDSSVENKTMLLIIDQESGVSIEDIVNFGKRQSEILLPPITTYKVQRFEDHSELDNGIDYIVYLREE